MEDVPADGFHGRVIGLAGIFQAVALVDQAARTGAFENQGAFEASIGSLFQFDAPTPAAIFGGVAPLRLGLTRMHSYFAQPASTHDDAVRYYLVVLVLERRIFRRNDLLATIRNGLGALRQDMDRVDDPLIAEIAALYQQTVSKLEPRVMVSGQPEHLKDPMNVNRIRALLLSALRSAVLWRQLGGTRLSLIFSRRRLARGAATLASSLAVSGGGSSRTCEGTGRR